MPTRNRHDFVRARWQRLAAAACVVGLSACTSVDELVQVGDQHLADVRAAPFHVAVRPVRISRHEARAADADAAWLPGPSDAELGRWSAELAQRLQVLRTSSVAVEATDRALDGSPLDLAITVGLAWRGELQQERDNLLGSFLVWGFLWPFSVTSVAAVEDRSYATSVGVTIRLEWLGAATEQTIAGEGPLRLTLPERQASLWWKLAAFSPIYFWVPDDPELRTAALHEQLLDRVARRIARLVKLDDRIVSGISWDGDVLAVEVPVGVDVSVPGAIRADDGSRCRFIVPREATRVRMRLERTAGQAREVWTQTIVRPGSSG